MNISLRSMAMSLSALKPTEPIRKREGHMKSVHPMYDRKTGSNNSHAHKPTFGSSPLFNRKPACPCDGGCPRCVNNKSHPLENAVLEQFGKIETSHRGDIYEHEAESVADQVVNYNSSLRKTTTTTATTKTTTGPHMPRMRFQAAFQSESPKSRAHLDETLSDSTSRNNSIGGGGKARESVVASIPHADHLTSGSHVESGNNGGPPSALSDLQSNVTLEHSALRAGNPLSQAVRNYFEPLFGINFDKVRIHVGPHAGRLARTYNADAFTLGVNIVFAQGQYNPDTAKGKRLLAHELTHVIQQQGTHHSDQFQNSGSSITSSFDNTVQRRTGGHYLIQRQEETGGPSATPEQGAQTAEEEKGYLDRAGEIISAGIDFAEESIESIVNRIAPGLIPLLRDGIGPSLNNMLCSALDSFVSSALGSLENLDFISLLEGGFNNAKAKVDGFTASFERAASDQLGNLLSPLVEAISEHGLPFIRSVQSAMDSISGAFNSVWTSIGKPVVDFLGEAGTAAWEAISSLATRIWDLTEPVRRFGSRVWNWLKSAFNIGWESTEGARDWLAKKAGELWDSMKIKLEPFMGPLKIVGGILLTFSPLGPIIILNEVVLPLWEKLTWLWNNWNSSDILIRARETLHTEILPGIIGAVSGVSQAMISATEWITNIITQISENFGGLLGAVGLDSCLRSVARIMNFVGSQFRRLQVWAQEGFAGLMDKLSRAFNLLVSFLRPILEFLAILAHTITNPLYLPTLVASRLWQLIPDKLKPPIVTFLLELILTFVKAVPISLAIGPLGSLVKQAIISFLEKIRDSEDNVKISASNRIAQLLQGSLEFSAGLAWGILRGIWDGIKEPFEIVYMLIQVATRASRYIYGLIQRLFGGNVLLFGISLPRTLTIGRVGQQQTDLLTNNNASSPLEASTAGPTVEMQTVQPQETSRINPEQGIPQPSTATLSELQQASIITTGAAEELQMLENESSSQQNANDEGLFALLSSVWDSIVEGAERIGSGMADAFLGFLNLSDFEIGDKIGWIAGTIIFEIVLAYLTAGAGNAIKKIGPVLKTILKFLDLGGEILGALLPLVRSAGRPILRILDSVGGFARRIPGISKVLDRIATAWRAIFRYADEAAAATARAGGETAEAAGRRAAREVVEESGERAGKEATEETIEELGERGSRETAQKSVQFAEARIAARTIVETNDRLNTPIPLVLAELLLLKRRYRWIETFQAEPKAIPGHFRVIMVASRTIVDEDYDIDHDLPEGTDEIIDARMASIQGAHDVGVSFGRQEAQAFGLRDANWVNPFEFRRSRFGQGFDDVLQDSSGNLWIVEYKGGKGGLSPGQMDRGWVVSRIRKYREEGGALGKFWADRLQQALDSGRLHGIAYHTPIEGITPGITQRIFGPRRY